MCPFCRGTYSKLFMGNNILELHNVSKSFQNSDKSELKVLDSVSLNVEAGSLVAVTGASGSGKSTLLHLIGGLDAPDSGDILFHNESISDFSDKKRAEYRNQHLGFIYQFHYLMPELTVLENVAFPFLIKEYKRKEAAEKAMVFLERVGLGNRGKDFPQVLSGGERQRVAIARSLVNNPGLLLADEPTGNLDQETGKGVFDLFRELVVENGLTAVVVTHDQTLAGRTDKIYGLLNGRLQTV